MHDLLNHYPVYFPKRDEQVYTLKEFLNSNTNDKYHLPMIVNITSLNNYGRAIKNLFTKNAQLLLINIYELDSIIAEYHRSNEGRHHTHRHRLKIKQEKVTTKATTKFRSMKKLSKSLASLATVSQPNNSNDDDSVDGEDDQTYHQRHLVKNLNEKRSSAIPLCRLPIQYRRYFELLDENDKAIEPYHKLTDLIRLEYDDQEPEKRIEKWPQAFFLRSPCSAYTKKETSEFLHIPIINDQNSNSTASNDSCYGSASDLDLPKDLIILNEEVQTLQAGQILMILGECLAVHERILEKEVKEQQQQQPPSPSPSHLLPSWLKDKSKLFFSRIRRQSSNTVNISNILLQSKTIPNKCDSYLKCQTQQGDIIYLSFQESGLFSPLNLQTSRSKSTIESTRLDISGVFQLKNLLSNFRLPLSVRHLDGSISFEHLYSPASINRQESPTKLRLLMPYNEQVIFACPLNSSFSKSSKASSPCMVIPLSVDADIEIQPCINMSDVSRTEHFHKLLDRCFQLIEHYQNEISLIHFPLQLTNHMTRRKQALQKKRSQSASFVEFFDDGLQPSNEQFNYDNSYTDQSALAVPSPLRYRDSLETMRQKLSTDTDQPIIRRSGYYTKMKNEKEKRYSRDEYTSEDEIYGDVDKIYDYIRSGDITDDVEKIQAKERVYHDISIKHLPNLTNQGSEQTISAINPSPGKMITHRFIPKIDTLRPAADGLDFHSCKNDGNVDDDQAHALYLASKQRTKTNSQDYAKSKPTTKMKRINKH